MRPFMLPPRPPWFDDLLAHVRRAFEVTGAGTPGWPNPHAGRDVAEEEYSRVTDPGKYLVLHARVEAWVRALARLDMATTVDIPPSPWQDAVRGPDGWRRVRQVTPARPGALGLLVAETLVDGAPFGIDLGLGSAAHAPVHLDSVPSCGCDACDSGSDDLLETLDGWFLSVARGGVVHARSGASRVSRTADGWQGTGDGQPFDTWLDEAAEAPGVLRLVGAPWM